MGVDWSLREGYAWAEDKEHCEEYGRMLQADPNKVSSKAKKRGLPQVTQRPRPFQVMTSGSGFRTNFGFCVKAGNSGSREPLR